ncbi:putative trans-sialidase, Group V [Trypanosoma cruzi]|nr:putative trans-sialidase, Group V [Trypanosoma cruzi]
MLSRVAAVKAPRTQNRRRVTGSSVRRREGGESEPQRPNMSRRVFTSAVLLLLVAMMCCGTGGAAGVAEQSDEAKFKWRAVTDGETVESLGVPGLLKVGNDVFAVAEAQLKDGETSVFTGIASQLLTKTADKKPEEVLKNAKDTQFLEEVGSGKATKVDVSRPTAAVKGSDIYMLVGQYGSKDSQKSDAGGCELLLVKGSVSGEGTNNKIDWKDTESSPQRLFGAQLDSWTRLIGSGGSGVKMKDGTLVFPVEGTKKEKDGKTVSLIIYSSDTLNWKLSKGMSDDGCSDPSVVEWKGKLMMMTACDDGRRRVYEIGDMGEEWTEALGTLSRVCANKHKGNVKGVGSGFITATFGDGGEQKNVMLVTLPVYADNDKEKGKLHLWLTDNTHIVDIGSVSGDDVDAAASSLLYKSGESGDANDEELIALYEKKGDGKKTSLGMVSVRLTEQLQRVKDVLTTWKEVDERVSKLYPLTAAKNPSTATACSDGKITDGLVGFLSGNLSDGTWKDEYLGVNATVNNNQGAAAATLHAGGVKFTGRGAWAEWPVGKQGENQLYHFANYNFALVATVSFDKVPKGGTPIPLMGVRAGSKGEKTKVMELSYGSGKKWHVLCGDGTFKELSSTWETETQYQVAIVLQNGTQGSVYVDGQRVGAEECALGNGESKGILHFYIGGDGENADNKEGVSVTVTNVLLYNRPLDEAEITALNPNKAPTPSSVTPNAQQAGTSSALDGTQQKEQRQSMGSIGEDSGGASPSAVSAVSTPSAGEESVMQVASGKSSDGNQTVDGGSFSDGEPTVETREGGTNGQKEEVQPLNRDVNNTALNSSSLGNVSQGNNSDGGTMSESGLLPSLLLLLLGLWVCGSVRSDWLPRGTLATSPARNYLRELTFSLM